MKSTDSADIDHKRALNPVVKAALSSLDISLEEELKRYERNRTKYKISRSSRQSSTSSTGDPEPEAFTPVESKPEVDLAPASTMIHQPDTTIQEGDLADLASSTTPPEDYLESSEQLLNSLGEATPVATSRASRKNAFLTPLGISSVLMMLAAGALVATALLKPQSFESVSQLFRGETGFQNSGQQEPTAAKQPQAENNLPIVPDLTEKELKDLNLEELPSLEGSTKPAPAPKSPVNSSQVNTPTQIPSPSVSATDSNLSQVLLPPIQQPPTTQPSLTPLPSPNTIPTAPAPVATAPPAIEIAPAPTKSDYYYTLVNYTDASSLAQARTVVPDAYVRKFAIGSRIQMGAFLSQRDAQRLVDQLKAQGIEASVYRP